MDNDQWSGMVFLVWMFLLLSWYIGWTIAVIYGIYKLITWIF